MRDHCEVGEGSKLTGIQNYNVWCIKMEAILRRERLWPLVERKQTPAAFPTTIEGVSYPSEDRLLEYKARVRSGLILSVANKLISLVASKQDPVDSWDLLKKMFNAGDQQQILLLTNKLYSLSMKEGGDVSTYLTEASELRDRLRTLGEEVSDMTLNSIVLNGLPRTYEMVIQGISFMTNPSFEDVMGKILTETHRLALRDQKLGQDEALSAHSQRPFFRGGGMYHRGNFGNFGGCRGRGYFRAPTSNFSPQHLRSHFSTTPPSFLGPHPMSFHFANTVPSVKSQPSTIFPPPHPGQNFRFRTPRQPIYCYSCGGPGHFARDCWNTNSSVNFVHVDHSYPNTPDPNTTVFSENYVGAVDHSAAAAFTDYYDDQWYVDSGATSHVTGQQATLELVHDNSMGHTVTTADGGNHQVSGIGSTTVNTTSGGINLNRVLYVPALRRSLMSVGSLADEGHVLIFTDAHCLILDNNTSQQVIAVGDRDTKNGLYKFTPTRAKSLINNISHDETLTAQPLQNSSSAIHLWHKRYGHLHYAGLLHLLRVGRVQGLPFFGAMTHVCGACLAGRQCRERFPKHSINCSTKVLQLIHSDLIGPIKFPSLGGSRFFVVFTDDFSRKSWVYFMKYKSETLEKFKEFKQRVETETGQKIICLRSDRGGEYLSRDFSNFCVQHGIHRQLTMAHTPQQNGVSERRNRTLVE
jgi:hypothetical protein